MSTQSMMEVAYELVSGQKRPISFNDLWAKVVKKMGLDEATALRKMSNFYTKLTMDGRFAQKDNRWTLKSRLKFADSYVDTSEIEIEDDYEEEEEDEYTLEEENSSEEY